MCDPCLDCPHLHICSYWDISPQDCDTIDFTDPDDITRFITEDNEGLANSCIWNIVDNRCVDTLLDYGESDCGDEDDVVEECA